MKDTMSEAPEDSRHPALKFLLNNAVLIGIVAVVVISLIVILVKQGASADQAAAPVPAVTATAAAASPKATASTKPSASASASAAPSTSSAATPTAAASEKPSATPSPTEAPLVGTTNQSVSVQNWRPFAEKFSAAYGNTAGGKAAWLARMRPLVTDDLYEGFKLADISRVQALTFTSVNTTVEENAYATFTANYSEKAKYIDGLIQVQNDGSWKVHKVTKHDG
jgi:hypothetical protein